MIVIKRGEVPEDWLPGKEVTCPTCGTIAQFEHDDLRNPKLRRDQISATMPCPVCNDLLMALNPNRIKDVYRVSESWNLETNEEAKAQGLPLE